MAVFRFRFQPVLDGKIKVKEDAEASLAERQRELAAEEFTLQQLQEKKDRVRHEVQLARKSLQLTGNATGGEVLSRTDLLNALKDKLDAANQDVLGQRMLVEQFQARVEGARQRVADCTREVDVLQKYRDKLEARFLRELAQKEELELDETGNILFLTRSRNT